MKDDIGDLISKWLMDESFILRRFEAPPEARVKWGVNVSTPGTPGVNFTVVNPLDKPDRYILALAILISPEHARELDKLKPAERLRVMHSILSKALTVCADCKIMVQPNILSPQAIAVNMELFEEEIHRYGKPFFLRLVWRLLNTYLAIVSGFNEWMPIPPPGTDKSAAQAFI
ncbi:DUF2299 domain-containing protein [Desulfurococcus mucosus]|uniref:DUF2299 domain-containing protein n=1 Tax=Desulfurococcus mucosus (strain ATCC 35584 / DSM 2162 / JCM 9187 / O7/1) TaxID=765177 RepID=E8R8T3_DESM0|nr:DUF2299 family protein [Desulfurococcus mucosus]ADV64909.1 Protein of unknown function DUF2299 [Desulfurococcus mucosus DSM 2162]